MPVVSAWDLEHIQIILKFRRQEPRFPHKRVHLDYLKQFVSIVRSELRSQSQIRDSEKVKEILRDLQDASLGFPSQLMLEAMESQRILEQNLVRHLTEFVNSQNSLADEMSQATKATPTSIYTSYDGDITNQNIAMSERSESPQRFESSLQSSATIMPSTPSQDLRDEVVSSLPHESSSESDESNHDSDVPAIKRELRDRAPNFSYFPPLSQESAISNNCDDSDDENWTGGDSKSLIRSKKSSKPPVALPVRQPPPDHPIWGEHSIMRGVIKTPRSYKLVARSKTFRVFGHNGLAIGQCWPNWSAALRDGAHGHSQGGISGNSVLGAYSIVVSGHYGDLDQDDGETLIYSGSNSLKWKEDELQKNARTDCLRVSCNSGQPVRVFRTYKATWHHRPRAGMRYDGLYTVEETLQKVNQHGGSYLSFKLRRNNGQPPIAIDQPTKDLVAMFLKVKDGY